MGRRGFYLPLYVFSMNTFVGIDMVIDIADGDGLIVFFFLFGNNGLFRDGTLFRGRIFFRPAAAVGCTLQPSFSG